MSSEADTFSAENDLEIHYKGENVTDLPQAYLVVSGKMKMCELPHIQRALYMVFDLCNAKLVASYKFKQKNAEGGCSNSRKEDCSNSIGYETSYTIEGQEKWLEGKR